MPAPIEEEQPARFTPYESPLRMFKSYRYHPSYAQDIPGGFLSLTFSHQIDPEKPFCQYESAGGSCNDPECNDQHFRDVAITGASSELIYFFCPSVLLQDWCFFFSFHILLPYCCW
jgi:hypothetical protein